MPLRLEPFGDAALRVRLPETANHRAVLDALRSLPRVIDAVVAERHALVTFDPSAPPQDVEPAIERALSRETPAPTGRRHTVCVAYDGEDLEQVARMSGLSVEEVVAVHTDGDYVVGAIGFMPGFAYLRGLDARLVLPRRSSPRPRVAASSVGVGGPYTGVYPFASPGGWSIVGRAVDFVPFDARTGASLALGDRVRFTRARSPREGSP